MMLLPSLPRRCRARGRSPQSSLGASTFAAEFERQEVDVLDVHAASPVPRGHDAEVRERPIALHAGHRPLALALVPVRDPLPRRAPGSPATGPQASHAHRRRTRLCWTQLSEKGRALEEEPWAASGRSDVAVDGPRLHHPGVCRGACPFSSRGAQRPCRLSASPMIRAPSGNAAGFAPE